MSEIWAILEYEQNMLHEQSGELLHEAIDIAHRQQEQTTVHAILLTASPVEVSDLSVLASTGVKTLDMLEHAQLVHYTTEGYISALAWFIRQHSPLLVLAHATPNGRDYMPRLAALLHLPFISGCLGLDLHDDALFALRSIYEGRAYVQTRTALHRRTALATLIPGVRGTPVKKSSNESSSLNTNHYTPELAQPQARIRRIALEAPSPEEVELDAADRIVAGGRGIGQNGFTSIAAFAHSLGAAVGATRVATDLGWVEHARQIGATGKIVHPKLYIACGISGAAQHTNGMSESQTVIAINPDRSAPIFALADLGLLGDANQILPLAATILAERQHCN
ncbi:MAG: electron transfer flavoprotein subunit alpha/FixB family protein [Ktedonobacteraceae bacterium]